MDSRAADKSHQKIIEFDRLSLNLRTAMPGVIVLFNSHSNPPLADVQPAIPMRVTDSTIAGAESSYHCVSLPVIKNVPICLPHSRLAGLFITVPIKTGDDCLLVISDRALDEYIKTGGLQPVTAEGFRDVSPRHHDFTDAICIPGILAGLVGITDWNTDALELRNAAGSTKLSIYSDRIEGKGPLNWKGTITVTDAGGAESDIIVGGVGVRHHVHAGVRSGDSSTAPMA